LKRSRARRWTLSRSSDCATGGPDLHHSAVLPEEAGGCRVPARRHPQARGSGAPAFTTKEDLRDNYPFGLFAVPMERVVRIHASSGTTGKPTVVATPGGTSTPGRSSWPAPCPAAGHQRRHRAQRLRLRPVHRGLGAHYGAEKSGSGHSHVGREHQTADPDHEDFGSTIRSARRPTP